MRVFVTGAAGFIGKNVCRALVAAGHEVVALSRRQRDGEGLPGLTWFSGDVLDSPETLATGLTGCDAVVHAVGIITEVHPEGQTFEAVHVRGTRNVLEAVRLSGAALSRFLYLSAIGASINAPSHYARTKALAEAAVGASGLPWTILRPSIVLGPDALFLKQMERLVTRPPLSPFPLPFVPVPGDGQTRFQPVHVDDLTAIVVNALTDPDAAEKTIEVCGGGDPVTFDDMLRTVQERVGTSKPLLHVPLPLMFAGAACLEALLPRPPITTDQLINLQRDNIGENAREVMGVAPLTFAEALERTYAARERKLEAGTGEV